MKLGEYKEIYWLTVKGAWDNSAVASQQFDTLVESVSEYKHQLRLGTKDDKLNLYHIIVSRKDSIGDREKPEIKEVSLSDITTMIATTEWEKPITELAEKELTEKQRKRY